MTGALVLPDVMVGIAEASATRRPATRYTRQSVSSTVAADLGTHKSLKGNARALSTVTGIIDGTGSVGAAVGQYLVGVLDNAGGWCVLRWRFPAVRALSRARWPLTGTLCS